MPALSVIIPTADRQDFAQASARQAFAAWPAIEVVIADSSIDARLKDDLADLIGTGRLVYHRARPGIDVVSNFEGAIDHATGEYLLFMGDDDFIGPNIDQVVGWAQRCGADAIVSYGNTFLASYFWPGVVSRFFGAAYAGKLFVYQFDGKARQLDPNRALRSALRNLGHGLGLMPRAYHGLIARQLVDSIRAKYGRLFGGVSPDIFSATLISVEAKAAYQVSYPFCVPGASPKSTAGLGAARTDKSALRGNPHIIPFENLQWDPLIPEFYSPATVWAYSFKCAIDLIGRDGLEPNLPRLYARSLIHYWKYRSFTCHALANYARHVGRIHASAMVGREMAGEILRQILRVLTRLRSPRAKGAAIAEYSGLEDIGAAYQALQDHLLKRGPQLCLS